MAGRWGLNAQGTVRVGYSDSKHMHWFAGASLSSIHGGRIVQTCGVRVKGKEITCHVRLAHMAVDTEAETRIMCRQKK